MLCTLILIALEPGMDKVSAYGADLLTGSPDSATVSSLFFPPAVSLSTLTLAPVLARVQALGADWVPAHSSGACARRA